MFVSAWSPCLLCVGYDGRNDLLAILLFISVRVMPSNPAQFCKFAGCCWVDL
jgi:hypothetical protein